MPRKKHNVEEIVTRLRQVGVLTAQGRSVGEAIRSIGGLIGRAVRLNVLFSCN